MRRPNAQSILLVVLLLVGTIGWTTEAFGQPRPSVPIHPDVRASIQRHGAARVIVELRTPRGAHVPEGDLAGALLATGHRVVRQFSTVPFVALEIGDDALRALEASVFDVARVVEDTVGVPHLATTGPLVQADQAWARGFDGAGMTVAVLDTGVDSTHPFLTGKVVEEACFSLYGQCPNGQTTQIGPGAGAPCAASECFHGTHVAGIAAGNGATAGVTFSGVARGATVVSVQVFNNVDGNVFAYWSDILAALEHIYTLRDRHQFAAVNLSLGSSSEFTAPCDGDILKPAIDNLRSVGIATVAAAGNSGSVNSMSSPACISSVVSVAASYTTDLVTIWSDIAWFTSLVAPGAGVQSAIPGGGFAYYSGTSMAAPHVAGAWAVLKQASPGASVTEILTALQETGAPAIDTRSGGAVTRPRIRVADALDRFAPAAPTASITSPINGATVSGTVTVTMSVTSAKGSPTQFALKLDAATALSSQSVPSGSTATFGWNTRTAVDGTHTLNLTVTDGAGRAAAAAITVLVKNADTTPPTVNITLPLNGAAVSGTTTVAASASDNVGVASVQFKLDGVNLGAAATAAPYAMAWDTTTAAPGTHTLTAVAKDAAGNTTTAAPVTVTVTVTGGSPVSQPVVWTSAVKVAVSGNTITKNAGCNGCSDAGAISQQTIASGNAAVEFTVSPSPALTVGLSTGNPGTSQNEIKFGLRFSGGTVEVRESGVYKAAWSAMPGAVHKVAVEAAVVKYYQNGTLKYTSAQAPTYPLLVDSSVLTVGAGVQNAVISTKSGGGTPPPPPPPPPPTNGSPPPGGNVVWTSAVNVAVSGSTITKNAGCNGCGDAGAISQQTIPSGSASVSFTISAGAQLTVGLSTGNAGTSGSEIKFGLRFSPGSPGYVEVRESGVYKSTWTLVAGAVYKIAVEGGVVKYSQNGTLKYTSAASPTYPLIVDTSLNTLGGAVQSAVIGP